MPPIPGQSNGGCCLGSGSVSSGREGRWGAGQVSPGTRLTASGHSGWGVGGGTLGMVLQGLCAGAVWTWLPPSLAGTDSPTPKGSPPGGGGSSSSSNSIRGAGASAAMAGRAAGRTDGQKHHGRRTASRSPGDPLGHPRLRPAPAGSGNPAPGEGGERGVGGPRRASARALGPPRSPPAPRDSGRPAQPPARSRNGVSAGMGPNTPAPVRRGADGRSPRLGLPTCPADSRSPLRELPENQVRWRGDSAQCRCPHAVSAPRMSVPVWKSNPGIPPLRTQHRPAHWDDDPVAVVIQPPRLSRLSLGPGQAWLECPGQRDRNWQSPGTPEAISRLRGAPADSLLVCPKPVPGGQPGVLPGLTGPAAHGGSQVGPCLTLGFSNKTSQTYEFIHIYISHTTDCKLQDQGAGRRRV